MAGSTNGGRRKDAAPVPYDQFRTGLTFAELAAEVAEEYRVINAQARDGFGSYRTFTRRAVLRRWRSIKLGMWESYLDGFNETGAGTGREIPLPD